MKRSIRKGHVPSKTDTLWPHWECIKDVTIVSINRVDYNHSFNPSIRQFFSQHIISTLFYTERRNEKARRHTTTELAEFLG